MLPAHARITAARSEQPLKQHRQDIPPRVVHDFGEINLRVLACGLPETSKSEMLVFFASLQSLKLLMNTWPAQSEAPSCSNAPRNDSSFGGWVLSQMSEAPSFHPFFWGGYCFFIQSTGPEDPFLHCSAWKWTMGEGTVTVASGLYGLQAATGCADQGQPPLGRKRRVFSFWVPCVQSMGHQKMRTDGDSLFDLFESVPLDETACGVASGPTM